MNEIQDRIREEARKALESGQVSMVIGWGAGSVPFKTTPVFIDKPEDAEKLVKGRDDAAGAYRIYYNRGTERASLGMLDAAVGDYQRAIVLNPDFAESFGNLGAAYAQLGVWDKAIAALRQAIKITDKSGRTFASAHGNLGTVYFRQGQWDSSVAAFTTALEISRTEGKNPTPRDIHGRAQAYEKSGDMQRAQADYRVSCRLANRGCDKVVH